MLNETLELPGADPVLRRAYVKDLEAQKVFGDLIWDPIFNFLNDPNM